MARSCPTATCICNRQVQDVRCNSCDYIFIGRVQKPCPKHPNEILLMDSTYCPKCFIKNLTEIKNAELSVNVTRGIDVTELNKLRSKHERFCENNPPENLAISGKIVHEEEEQTSESNEMKHAQGYSGSGNKLANSEVQTDYVVDVIDDHHSAPITHNATKRSFMPTTVCNDSYGNKPKLPVEPAENNFLREVLKKTFTRKMNHQHGQND